MLFLTIKLFYCSIIKSFLWHQHGEHTFKIQFFFFVFSSLFYPHEKFQNPFFLKIYFINWIIFYFYKFFHFASFDKKYLFSSFIFLLINMNKSSIIHHTIIYLLCQLAIASDRQWKKNYYRLSHPTSAWAEISNYTKYRFDCKWIWMFRAFFPQHQFFFVLLLFLLFYLLVLISSETMSCSCIGSLLPVSFT